MNLTKQIAEKAGIRLFERPRDAVLIASGDAGTFLDECEESDVMVLAFEGFNQAGEEIVPEMDVIADFSDLLKLNWIDAKRKSIALARGFLRRPLSHRATLIEFELLGRDDFTSPTLNRHELR